MGRQQCKDADACGRDRAGSAHAADAPATAAAKKGLGMLGGRDILVVALYVLWETVNVLCIAWAKDPVTKKAAYSAPSLVFAAESAKFAISAAQLRRASLGAADVDWEQNWKFAIPALLYSINNNLFVYILRIVPGSVFQMLCNLRSLYTGVLFYFLMDRRLSGQQWVALLLLVCGAALCQYANIDDTSHLRVSQWGVLLSVVYGFISVGAGVWSELLLKRGTKSIHLDNAQLYAYGMFFNFVGVLMSESTGGEWQSDRALRGWNVWSTWIICFNMAASGIVCSVVLKYYDNVIKIFAVTVSNAVVYVFDIFIMQDQSFHPLFLLGLVVVAFAMARYVSPQNEHHHSAHPRGAPSLSELSKGMDALQGTSAIVRCGAEQPNEVEAQDDVELGAAAGNGIKSV